MISTPRRRSFNRVGYWFCLFFITLFLVLSSPLGFFPKGSPQAAGFSAYLSFPFVLVSFGWLGPVWGLGAASWLALLTGLTGLTLRDLPLILFPFELSLFSFVAHRGLKRWQMVLQENRLRVFRASEEINTREEKIHRGREILRAGAEKLKQYQGLRGLVNRLNLNLPLEDLTTTLVASVGEQIPSAERVLFYLVSSGGLHLELKKVWRRSGSEPIRAKTGDAYDQWVMRQGQPLLVETIGHDFRFSELSPALDGRTLGSLLVVPLKSEHRFLGVLRVEAVRPKELRSDDLRLLGIVGDLASLAVEKSFLYGRTAELANTDDLTGLAVKSFFLNRLEQEVHQAAQTDGMFSVLLVDIDHFKGYNDTFGHSAGDKLLRQTGSLLNHWMRPGDLAARFGGEEFVCLIGGGSETGITRAQEIRARIEATPVELRRAMARATVSVGVAFYPADGREASLLLRTADRRLYQAKESGRNRVCSAG